MDLKFFFVLKKIFLVNCKPVLNISRSFFSLKWSTEILRATTFIAPSPSTSAVRTSEPSASFQERFNADYSVLSAKYNLLDNKTDHFVAFNNTLLSTVNQIGQTSNSEPLEIVFDFKYLLAANAFYQDKNNAQKRLRSFLFNNGLRTTSDGHTKEWCFTSLNKTRETGALGNGQFPEELPRLLPGITNKDKK